MKFFIIAALSLSILQVQTASACVIAVESNTEVTLLREVYNLKNLKLTTQTQYADVGFKLVPQIVKKADPVFGEIKMNETVNVRADIYEKGQVVASTAFHLITNFSQREESPFSRDLIRTLATARCN